VAGPLISVVGAGASAVALLHALNSLGNVEPGELLIYDPSPHLWRGRAYQPDEDCVRVNSVPTDMSIVAHDQNHLLNWLQAREIMLGRSAFTDEISGSVFIPRAVYGDYLEQSARQALLLLGRRGWQVAFVRERITRIRQRALQLEIVSGTEKRLADYVVLATGAGAPTDVYGLAGTTNFIADPYPVGRVLFGLADDAAVSVIGTGLTAVDVALGLRAKGHRGPIRLLSRSGSLPGVRQRAVPVDMRHFTVAAFKLIRESGGQLDVRQVTELMQRELAYQGQDPADILAEVSGLRHESGIERLRRHLSAVDDSSLALRIVQQAVPEVGPDIWPYLPDHEQEDLLRGHYRAIMSLCCPMPPVSAKALLAMADSGQLTVESGLENIRPRAGGAGFDVTVGGVSSASDVVVSAVNARVRGYSTSAASLVDSLVSQGLAIAHPRGGLVTRRRDSRVHRPDGSSSAIYSLGDPASGSFFFTFGVQSLVDRAVDIAQDLAMRIHTHSVPGRDLAAPATTQGARA
jgi:uncharacterized NAD(P)/FAD-binding protein YdhS